MIPLVCSSYTLGTEVGLADRVHAAAAAGFDGIGLRAENYWDAQQAGLDDADILAMVDHHATRVLEVEYLTGWGAADRDDAQQARERTVFHLARTFGVRHVNAGLLERLPFERTVHAFAALCDRAGDDLTVALEFMPYSGIPTLTAAWRVIAEAGKANAALIVDVWHWARAGTTRADLEGVPPDRIVSVQLCDVLEHPMDPPRAESLGHRLPPGRGHGDAAGMVRSLQDHGVRPSIVTAEVISHELAARGPDVAAQVSFDAAQDVLTRAG